jgi:hypothetical protein
MAEHHIQIRDALIKLFEDQVQESYKVGRKVLHIILGCNIVPNDRPILCFNTNSHLTAIAKLGVAPIMWKTKARRRSWTQSKAPVSNFLSIS